MLSSEIQLAIQNNVSSALQEDIRDGDITAALLNQQQTATAHVISRQAAVICGTNWFNAVFDQLGNNTKITWHIEDGDKVTPNQVLCSLSGNAATLLSGERCALNFLQTLSATATVTHHYVQLLEGTHTRLLDTRKTIPGLRLAQKYAVSCGGGCNHRIGLYDAFLIKENHIITAGSIANACAQARALHADKLLEIEVEDRQELEQALVANVDRIMLDNFSLEDMREAVALTDHRIPLEASGNVSENTLRNIAETGVDYISVGALTKHIQATDLSMRFID